MSWFSRKKEFPEEADILGDDFEAEFDGIADAFNGLFQVGVVESTANKILTGSFADLPGASKELTVSLESKLIVIAVVSKAAGIESNVQGTINIDGVDNSGLASASDCLSGTQVYSTDLSAGAHTVKLRARLASGTLTETLEGQSRFLYLVIPKP